MKIISVFFNLLILINSAKIRDIKDSCGSNKNPSNKDCGVYSINDNYRCCYIQWTNKDILSEITHSNHECIYVENKLSKMKEEVNRLNTEGYQNVKIFCYSYFLNYKSFLFLLFIII